jgi:hypothetical protein
MTARTLLLCAFVLWGNGFGKFDRTIGSRPLGYRPLGTYLFLDECQEASQLVKGLPKYAASVCLPDTVNPNTK